jgi:hypothetical protein
MKFDKTIFQKQSFEDADLQKNFWKSKSYSERLEAGVIMTQIAFGLVGKPFPKMEKALFKKRKHG